MPQFSLSELANSAGTSAANVGINLAKEAKGLACGLYKNYSGWATTFGLGTAPPASFVKGVWDTICADDPGGLPVLTPAFSGGQCVCDYYQVFVRVETREVSGNIGVVPEFECRVFGPILGVSIGEYYPGYSSGLINCRAFWGNGCQTQNDNYPFVDVQSPREIVKVDIVRIVYAGSGSDNCGSPPPLPPDTTAPPSSSLTKNVTINYNDGTDFTTPLTYVQMNNDLDIIVDVGGVAFNFNVDKVNFDWNFGPSGQPNAPPGSGGGGSGGSGSGSNSSNINLNNKIDNLTNKIDVDVAPKLDDINVDIDNLKDIVNQQDDCCPEPPDPVTQVATVCPIDNGNTYSGLVDLLSVKLNITKLPLSSKIQFGNSSPNVLFAGWLAFTHDDQAYEREPIHFEYNLFTPPKGANGFFYCLTNGAKGRVIYYTKA